MGEDEVTVTSGLHAQAERTNKQTNKQKTRVHRVVACAHARPREAHMRLYMLCGQKPLVRTQKPNRTDYTWFRLGCHKEVGDALQRRLLSVLMLFKYTRERGHSALHHRGDARQEPR